MSGFVEQGCRCYDCVADRLHAQAAESMPSGSDYCNYWFAAKRATRFVSRLWAPKRRKLVDIEGRQIVPLDLITRDIDADA